MPEVPDPTLRERLLDGLGAGVVATLVMTAVLFALESSLPRAALRALHALTDHPPWLVVALAAHLAYGGIAGALYFGGARRVTLVGGMGYGLALWGVAMAVYAPLVGLGFVASHSPALALVTLPAHLLYGVALGAFAPRGEITNALLDVPDATA